VISVPSAATLVKMRHTPFRAMSRPLVTKTFGLEVLVILDGGGPTRWSTVNIDNHNYKCK